MMRKWKGALFLARHPENLPETVMANMMSQTILRRALYHYADWQDRRDVGRTQPKHVPPASLRFRVHGDLSLSSFLASGKHCSHDIRKALHKVGKDIDSFQRILDFGCGCGRTLFGLVDLAPSAMVFGTDIDSEAIDWCQRHLSFASFQTNQAFPPLEYAPGTFDLVYAISVFTHLDEEYQFAWLSELRRVTQPRGFVVLTVHGSYYWQRMLSEDVDKIKKRGFLFMNGPASMQGIFPGWYQTAFHTQEYVLANYSKYFDILAYIPAGMDRCQDVIVLQKPQG